jgi:hypothetical protein
MCLQVVIGWNFISLMYYRLIVFKRISSLVSDCLLAQRFIQTQIYSLSAFFTRYSSNVHVFLLP